MLRKKDAVNETRLRNMQSQLYQALEKSASLRPAHLALATERML